MAPTKRPAAAAPKAAAKRGRKAEVAAVDPVAAQISQVSQALAAAGDFPASVRDLLSSLTVALTVPQADRHAFENEAAKIVGEALGTTRAAKAAVVAQLEAKVGAVDTERAATVAAALGAAALLEQKDGERKAAEDSTAKAVEAANVAGQEHVDALKEQEVGDAEALSAGDRKAKLEAFLAEYAAAKEAKASASLLQDLAKLGKDYALDANMLQTAPSALKSAPEARGDFGKLVLGKLDEALAEVLAKLQASVDNAEPAKAARAAKVVEAAEKLAKANADVDAAWAVQKAAQFEAKSATAGKRDADKAVKNFDGDAKKAVGELEAAKAALAAHDGIIATFNELLARAVAVPVVAEPESQAAPAEATAVA